MRPQWLVQLNARRVPTRSVWMGSLGGVLGILAAITSSQTVFAFLVNASGALMVFVYMIVALAHIRLRREREARGAPAPALSMWLFPWASYAAVAGMAAVLDRDGTHPGGARASAVLERGLTCGGGGCAYLVVNARRKARAGGGVAPHPRASAGTMNARSR